MIKSHCLRAPSGMPSISSSNEVTLTISTVSVRTAGGSTGDGHSASASIHSRQVRADDHGIEVPYASVGAFLERRDHQLGHRIGSHDHEDGAGRELQTLEGNGMPEPGHRRAVIESDVVGPVWIGHGDDGPRTAREMAASEELRIDAEDGHVNGYATRSCV